MPKAHVDHFCALQAKLSRAHGQDEVTRFVERCIAEPPSDPTALGPLWSALANCVAVLGAELVRRLLNKGD